MGAQQSALGTNQTALDVHKNFYTSNTTQYTATQPNFLPVDTTKYVNRSKNPANSNVTNDSLFGTLRPELAQTSPRIVYDPVSRGTIVNPVPAVNAESLKQLASPLTRIFDFTIPQDGIIPQEIIDKQVVCEKYNSATCNVNEYMRNEYNQTAGDALRCGFVYNPAKNIFQGHLGYQGLDSDYGTPIKQLNPGLFTDNATFYWNFRNRSGNSNPSFNTRDAKGNPYMGASNAFEYWKCQNKYKTCEEVQRDSNRTCVWSQSLGRAVPLRSGAYPSEEPRMFSNTCPPPLIPNPGQDSNTSNIGTCSNNGIDVQCVKDLLKYHNCSSNGAIMLALNNPSAADANSQNYFKVKELDSFSKYNAVYPAPGNLFVNPNLSVETASQWFKTLQSNASGSGTRLIDVASRALCYDKNAYDSYDFCKELIPSCNTYPLDCLQKEFRVKGGQMTGSMYPKTVADLQTKWVSQFPTWGAAVSFIDQMAGGLNSPDIDLQASNFNMFLGIDTQKFTKQYVQRIPGCEVFWFKLINTTATSPGQIDTFLGRRIQLDITPDLNNIPTANIQFVTYTNLRTPVDTTVKFNFTTSGQMKVLLNRNLNEETAITPGNAISSWTANPKITEPNCWPISKANPNYFTIATFGPSITNIFPSQSFQTCGANASNISADSYTMTQEPDAPMISFEVVPSPTSAQLNLFSFSQQANLQYSFGDARMRSYFPMSSNGSLSIDLTEQFGFDRRYDVGATTQIASGGQTVSLAGRTYIYGAQVIGSQSYLQSGKIGTQCWRTITMLFKTGSLNDILANTSRDILNYGPLKVSIKRVGTDCVFSVKFSGVEQSKNSISPNTYYYLLIIQDLDDLGTDKTTSLKISCVPVETMKSDTGSSLIFTDNTAQRYVRDTPGTSTWGTADAYPIVLGGVENTIPQSVTMRVAWLRFFDYVFTTDDVTSDVNNAWQRHWFNMI